MLWLELPENETEIVADAKLSGVAVTSVKGKHPRNNVTAWALMTRSILVAGSSAAAAWLTLLGFYGPTQIALAAPLAGVVVVVALTAARRVVALDLTVLSAVTLVVISVELNSWRLGGVAVATSVGQYIATVAVGHGAGTWPVSRREGRSLALPDVAPIAAAVVLAGLFSCLLRWSGLGLVPVSDLSNVLLTAVRTTTWGLAFGALGLLWATGDRLRLHAGSCARVAASGIEVILVLAGAGVLCAVAFMRASGLPALFPLFLVVAWAALRLTPLLASAVAVSIGGLGVIGTVHGRGGFAQIDDARVGAVAAQSFMLTLVAVALTLALANRDRERALTDAHALAQAASDRAFERDLVLGSLVEGVVLFDADGRVSLRNEAGREIFGRGDLPVPQTTPEASAVGLRALDGSELPDGYISNLLASIGPEPSELTLRLQPEMSSPKVLHLRMQRVTSHDEHRTLVAVTFRDITHEFNRTRELEAFAGVLAHDLARPLTVMQGWAEILVQDAGRRDAGPFGPRVVEDGGRILVAAQNMRRLLDDLLALTLADQRHLDLVVIDVSRLCLDVVKQLAGPDGIPVDVSIEPDLVALADETLVTQLLQNLLDNAIKYVTPGLVPAVAVSMARSSGSWLRIRVQDNGIGIPLGEQARVFEDYYRADSHRETHHGTGIGLAICRRIVERHDGRISVVASSPETGTLIEFSLPRFRP